MAQAVRFYEAGGPEVLRIEQVAVGEPGPGEVRVRHVAVGLNFADTYFRQGYYPVPVPNGMGVEASGVIEAVGPMFFAASTAGAAGAIVAALTPAALHGTAFAVLTLANNVFGLAPGPIVTGWLADRIGLVGALQLLPVASVAAALVFLASRGTAAQRADNPVLEA